MCVPVQIHPPRRDRIQNASAILRKQPCAFAAYNSRQRSTAAARKRMPNPQRVQTHGASFTIRSSSFHE
jgi:hypothetical protein